MDYKKELLYYLNSLNIAEEYFFEEYYPNKNDINSFQFSFNGSNFFAKRNMYFLFTNTDTYGVEICRFDCIIHRQVEAGSPSLYIKKYLLLEHNSDEVVMSLNYYGGDFEQKLKSFFVFFENLLNEPILSKVLAGELWTDKYDYTMAELTGK